MNFTEDTALFWIEKIIAFALIFETLELFSLRKAIATGGIWTWDVIKSDFSTFPPILFKIFEFFLKDPNFFYVLGIRLLAALLMAIFTHLALNIVLLLCTTLLCLRWRGTVNGGSDFMTLIILIALTLARAFDTNSNLKNGCLWYIAIQTCTSYFIAGLIKLRKPNWRSGRALVGFISSAIYQPNTITRSVMKLTLIASWVVMIFESLFPMALSNPEWCLFFIGSAFVFHVANFYIFGLNRFVFAWSATYPALYYCSLAFRLYR